MTHGSENKMIYSLDVQDKRKNWKISCQPGYKVSFENCSGILLLEIDATKKTAFQSYRQLYTHSGPHRLSPEMTRHLTSWGYHPERMWVVYQQGHFNWILQLKLCFSMSLSRVKPPSPLLGLSSRSCYSQSGASQSPAEAGWWDARGCDRHNNSLLVLQLFSLSKTD